MDPSWVWFELPLKATGLRPSGLDVRIWAAFSFFEEKNPQIRGLSSFDFCCSGGILFVSFIMKYHENMYTITHIIYKYTYTHIINIHIHILYIYIYTYYIYIYNVW